MHDGTGQRSLFAFSIASLSGKGKPRPVVCLTGADIRGTIFANQFSQSYLGVDPMYLWTDKKPEKRSSVTLPADFALSGLTLLLFLRDWRSSLIVVITIPFALLTAVVLLKLSGQTINIMTLGGLSLSGRRSRRRRHRPSRKHPCPSRQRREHSQGCSSCQSRGGAILTARDALRNGGVHPVLLHNGSRSIADFLLRLSNYPLAVRRRTIQPS
jgi:AcrB/AcrD/AcrF family